MLMTKEPRRPIRTLRGWAIHVLQEAGAIHECEEHGWAKDRADPHAREHAFDRKPGSAGRPFGGRRRSGSPRRAGFHRRYLPGVSG